MGRKFIIPAIALFLLYGFYLWGIPAILNGNIGLVEGQVQRHTGFRVSMANAKFAMGPLMSLQLKADEFRILNSDNSEALYSKAPNLKLGLFPLGKININKFHTDYLTAGLVFDERLKLGEYPLPELPRITYDDIRVNVYKITLDSKARSAVLSGEYKDERINASVRADGFGKVLVRAKTFKNGIDIEEMTFKVKGIDAAATGRISRMNAKFPHLDLQVKINPSRTENIVSLLPPDENLIPDINLKKMKETGF